MINELYEELEHKKSRLKELQNIIKGHTKQWLEQKGLAISIWKHPSGITKIMQGDIKKISTIELYIKLLTK